MVIMQGLVAVCSCDHLICRGHFPCQYYTICTSSLDLIWYQYYSVLYTLRYHLLPLVFDHRVGDVMNMPIYIHGYTNEDYVLKSLETNCKVSFTTTIAMNKFAIIDVIP